MQKKVIDVILLNLKIFVLAIFILFLIAVNLELTSHDTNLKKFAIIYFCFAIAHLFLNFFFNRLFKEQIHLLGIAVCETLMLYGLVACIFL